MHAFPVLDSPALSTVLASRKIVEAVDGAFVTLTIISAVLMVLIMGLLVAFVVKYRASKHPKPARIAGNNKLEIFWTVVPTLLAVWMFYIGYEGFLLMRDVPEDAYVVEVEGRQWAWTFTYPEERGVTSSEMVVPVGVPIKCELSSPIDDVLHSFYLPDFRVKEDCVPGLDTYLWFQADEITSTWAGDHMQTLPGKTWHNIFCAEFCGLDHAKMITKLHVVSREDFARFLDAKLQQRYRRIDDIGAVMDAGSEAIQACNAPVLYQTYCASCHGNNGEGGLVEGARSLRDDPPSKWKKGVKIVDIFRTLTLGLDGTRMRAFDNLSAWDRFALAHHVANLYKDGPERSLCSIEEYRALVKEYKLDEQKKVTRAFPIEEAIEELAAGE